MKKIFKSVLRSSMAKERMYNLAPLNTARYCPQNGLYTHYWFYSQLQKPEKDCFKCFVL